ncbi:MAG: glycoside hydrolase family 3 C-terminal domain-containing protein [Acidimicrobiia bacterium]|nr:glycoside hydrolase family 3 C-terminal domain-containing protein [Acidimicrobiia bacterium]
MSTPYELARNRVATGGDSMSEARALVESMTLDERLGLLDGGSPFWAGITDIGNLGHHKRPFPAMVLERLGIPGFYFSDGPRGAVIGGATAYPVSMARGASFDLDLEERIGAAIGREMRATGADLGGSVCVNLLRHPAWGRAQETYGEDPHHVGEMGAALTRGLQTRVMANVKHFAMNSIENSRFKVDITCDERTLHEVYLPHFLRIIDEGIASVMTAYNSVNGEWCGENHALITEILRGEWGFEGFVVSDWIFGLRDGVKSVKAGLDVEMPYRMIRHAPVVAAVADGSLGLEHVDAAVARTLSTMLRFGVGAMPVEPIEVLACDEHRGLSLESARKSAVLLRNESVDGAPLLPLDPGTLARLCVLGRFADVRNLGDGGSSDVMSPTVVTPFAGLSAALGHVDVRTAPADDLAAAVALAAKSDVAVVIVGYDRLDEGEFIGGPNDNANLGHLIPKHDDPELLAKFAEFVAEHEWEIPEALVKKPGAVMFSVGGDRVSLRLPDADVALLRSVIAVNPRTIAVIISGSAVLTSEWDQEVPAILQQWYSGMEGGHALADILLGAANPSGRLPFAVPAAESDLPLFDIEATSVTYDGLHGQWLLDRREVRAAYPFGFGLSYTHFDHVGVAAEVRGEVVEVRATTFNAGVRDGADVVQVYVTPPDPGIDRAMRRLGGFARVEVPAGEAAEVTVVISLRSIAWRDVDTHSWYLPAGEYRFEVAHNAGEQRPPGVSISLPEMHWGR